MVRRTPRRKAADTSSSIASAAAIGPTKEGGRKAPAKKKRKWESTEGDDGDKVEKKFDGKRYQYRKICSADGCTNQVRNGGVCKRHGATVKTKLCSRDGCTKHAQKGGVCRKHGATVKRCSKEGCENQAKKGGVCVKHGAVVKIKLCSSDGCTNQAKNGGVCKKHGAKVKRKLCNYKGGCKSFAQNGGLCIKHAAKYKRCSSEGCTNQVKQGGVCTKHGATCTKKRRCSSDGCTSFAKKGGVCKRHGAKVKRCSHDGCTNQAKNGGVCIKHGATVKQYLCSSEGCKNRAIKGGKCWTHGGKPPKCSSPGCQNYSDRKGVCIRHGARVKECKSEGCSYLAWRGGFCYRHREDRLTTTEVITEGAAVSVPALPPIDLPAVETGPNEDAELESSEPHCDICYETYNIDDLVKCGSDTSCTKSICHDCLVRNFLRGSKLDGGRLTNCDPTKCPFCLTEGAFSLDETDAAIVEREVATMYSEMHTFEQATVGASYASTSHEQGDLSDWEPNSGEEDDDE